MPLSLSNPKVTVTKTVEYDLYGVKQYTSSSRKVVITYENGLFKDWDIKEGHGDTLSARDRIFLATLVAKEIELEEAPRVTIAEAPNTLRA
jgi:hypothetical protein